MEFGDSPDYSGEAVLDAAGKEAASVLRNFLGLATLIALKTRERGQRDAEAKVKVTEQRLKEAREQQIREARFAKANDPRNAAMALDIERGNAATPRVERLGNGVPLHRTPEQLAVRAMAPLIDIPRSGNPAQEALRVMSRAASREQQPPAQELTPEQILARQQVQQRGPEPPIR